MIKKEEILKILRYEECWLQKTFDEDDIYIISKYGWIDGLNQDDVRDIIMEYDFTISQKITEIIVDNVTKQRTCEKTTWRLKN